MGIDNYLDDKRKKLEALGNAINSFGKPKNNLGPQGTKPVARRADSRPSSYTRKRGNSPTNAGNKMAQARATQRKQAAAAARRKKRGS